MELLSVQKVSKNFGGLQAVNNVTMAVQEGEIVALIGPNGSGKTTLANLITRTINLDEGRVFFTGQRIDGLSPHEIPRLGIVRTFQLTRLFKTMTVLENVMVGRHIQTKSESLSAICRFRSARIEEAASLEHTKKTLQFVGLEHLANVPAGSLPHGQQQLVQLARALATGPKLLFLDEPAAGLNNRETQLLEEMMRSILNRGIAILLIEHNMRLVMGIAHKVYVLNYGRLIAEGPPEQIKNEQAVIEVYLGKGIKGVNS